MSNTDQYWALPDGITEALPEQATQLERLRRDLLDLYATWGYELVIPPFVEYLESLRIAQGTELDLQTFKLTDQINGRQMGVRADMTPQVARIDAHKLTHQTINRLCYIGTVLRTRSQHRVGSRTPMQVGAELFGHSGLDSDAEVLSLMLATLQYCQVPDVVVSLSHVDVFRGLALQAELDQQQEQHYFDMLERKSLPELDTWLAQLDRSDDVKAMLHALPRLVGGVDVLAQAREALAQANDEVHTALNYLGDLVARLEAQSPNCTLHIDLTELSGYSYHTGVVYAAYTPENGYEIARGGRYDGIGAAFGRERPATGFSTNLHQLLKFVTAPAAETKTVIAPATQDQALDHAIAELRQQGMQVIRLLEGQSDDLTDYHHQLVLENGQWILTEV